MKLVKSVLLRRYTPPTCTLELWTERPIWDWRSSKGSGLELDSSSTEAEFILHFDDPRLIDEPQISLTGTPGQLAVLGEAVEAYVQGHLSQAFHVSPENAPLSLNPNQLGLQAIDAHRHCLQPGLLQVSPTETQQVNLSTVQLFDLMTALERYRLEEIEKIPLATTESEPETKTPLGFWQWAAIAVGLIFAMGVGRIGLRQWQNSTTEVTPNPTGISLAPQPPFQIAEITPPVPPPPNPQTVSPRLAAPLALRDPLPPPSVVTAATPPPRNPTVALVVPPRVVRPPALAAPPAPDRSVMAIPSQQTLTPLIAPVDPAPPAPPLDADSSTLPAGVNPNPIATLPPLATDPSTPFPNPIPSVRPLPPRSENLLDTIPQVAEVRQFYQQRWQPPEDQSQTLEYRLILGQTGEVKKITPLGKAASIRLAQLPTPPPLTPLTTQQSETIRLVLTPVGDVKTFLED